MSMSVSITNKFLNLFGLIKHNQEDAVEQYLDELQRENIDINQNLVPNMLQSIDDEQVYKDCMYYTPLYLATKIGNKKIIDRLLKDGANPRALVSEYNGLMASPYDLTILNNQPELTEMFNKYVEKYNSVAVIKTKVRSENTVSFNFRRKGNDLDIAPAQGKIQKF